MASSLLDTLWGYFEQLVKFAAENPKEFLVSFFICITPLMIICGYLAFLMIKQIEEKERAEKKKAARTNNIQKAKKKVTKAD